MTTAEREQDRSDAVRSFVAARPNGAQARLRRLEQERGAAGQAPSPRFEAPARPVTHERLVLHAEAMAGLLEGLGEQVHLLRDELGRLRAELAQR